MMDKNSSQQENTKRAWRSLDDEAQDPEFLKRIKDEFPRAFKELDFVPQVDRRRFLGVIGSSLALAGLTSTTGCIRKPRELVLPYTNRPENLVEGKSVYFASAIHVAGSVLGVLVESHEGRPTKVEGNPAHPMSLGSTSALAQAMILDMYDPDRSREPRTKDNANVPAVEVQRQVETNLAAMRAQGGRGLALLVDSTPSPTLRSLIKDFKKIYPAAKIYMHDAAFGDDHRKALVMAGQANSRVVYDADKAEVVLALDSDFLTGEANSVRNARMFSEKRRMAIERQNMSRMYVVEPVFSNTGAVSDHRLKLRASQIGDFLLALATELSRLGVSVSDAVLSAARSRTAAPEFGKFLTAVAADLAKNRGASIVVAGTQQPAWVQAAAFAINDALGNSGATTHFIEDADTVEMGTIAELASDLESQIKSVVMLGVNPVYTAPADLKFRERLANATFSLHAGFYFDETARLSTHHLPISHAFEAWGDLRDDFGTVSIQQPLISPLFGTLSAVEVMHFVNTGKVANGFDIVRDYHKQNSGGDDKQWRRWLHDGVAKRAEAPAKRSVNVTALAAEVAKTPAFDGSQLEVVFPLSQAAFDGRYANNPWMQEIPETMSKLTWDNAAFVNVATAKSLNVSSGDMIEVTLNGATLQIATFIVPGIADGTLILPLGYGRTFGGAVATGAGFDVNVVRSSVNPYFSTGASVKKTGKTYQLVTTQEHGSMEGRAPVREGTLEEYKATPNFVEKTELLPKEAHKTLLWQRPNKLDGQQWGMTIDLNVCTGCNACTVACNAENNIPAVGKDQVANGRELHWIRIDRYFTGSVDDPEAVFQPIACQHCENAPCESVCPVAATTHSDDGLNEMTYNRCIGTRYCANNCPYKVRRFNFFNYSRVDDESAPLHGMRKNPNVTVRFRGVMEKCTYCVQRIRKVQTETKLVGETRVPDGRILTACQQVCPTQAIVFGDVNDPNSVVSRQKAQPRNYTLLGELNTQPRTSFLAKLRNSNPELG